MKSSKNNELPPTNDNSNPQGGGSKYTCEVENATIKMKNELNLSCDHNGSTNPNFECSEPFSSARKDVRQVKIPPYKRDGRKLFVGGIGGNGVHQHVMTLLLSVRIV